jgi:hypothetical protein
VVEVTARRKRDRTSPAAAATPAVRPPAAGAAPLELARLRVAAGADPGDLDALGPRPARLLRVASGAGAPLLPALDAAAEADAAAAEADRAVAVASAQGRAVATGLLLAPLGLVPMLGRLFDVDLLAYHATSPGLLTGGVGLALLIAGAVMSRRAVTGVGRRPTPTSPWRARRRALAVGIAVAGVIHPLAGLVTLLMLLFVVRPRPVPADPNVAEAAELTAAAIGGGWSVAAALRLAADELPPAADGDELAEALRRLAFDLEHGIPGGDRPPGVDRLADVLTTAAAVGAPVGPTLRRFAADVRADELTRVLADAERLPVRLTFPTALCLLPGTLLLIGAPIVSAGLGSVGT